ncbi:MAG: O-methyltransferase [Planctomycetaceae bacterium]
MNVELWTAVDRYLANHCGLHDDSLDAALADSQRAGLPEIQVSPTLGKLLNMLVATMGARRVLEVGTLGGYSTIQMARGLPADGFLLSLELEQKHADVARTNIARDGLADRVKICVGPAIESLQELIDTGAAPFDFVFIDADKASTADYFAAALRLTRPGSLIVVDNVVRKGAVADANSDDPNVQGIRRFFEFAKALPRLDMTTLQTVGCKGHDGIAVVRV